MAPFFETTTLSEIEPLPEVALLPKTTMLIEVAPILKTATNRKLFYLCINATRTNDVSEFVSFKLFKSLKCISFHFVTPL